MSELKPRITENGIDYILVGDYYIPDLKLPEEHRPIGKYGRMHREYLREVHPARLNTLTLTGELWTYLADLNEQAQNRLDIIMEQMKAAEGVIRRFLIEKKNYIDAIIGLPANIFYGTSIPTCILVMKKCRKEDDNILFIDASKEFEKVKTQNKLRPQYIKKIVDTYRERKEIEKYSHLATLQEVADNDYNLNIPRYVDTFEEEEPIDIKAVMAEIKELEAKRAELDKEIEVYLEELGIV